MAAASMPARSRLRTTLSAPCLVRVKTSTRSICGSASTISRSGCLPALETNITRCSTRSTVVATGRHRDLHRIGQKRIGELRDRLRHRGGEEQRLPLCRNELHDPLQRHDEAEVEHLVGLVDDEDLDLAERQRPLLDEVEQPARRGDELSTPRESASVCGRCETPPNTTAVSPPAAARRRSESSTSASSCR